MGYFNQGLQRIRKLVQDDIDKGQLGTDGTAFASSQTDLQTAVEVTKLSVTKTPVDKQVTTDFSLPSTTGTGNTYKEFVLRDTNDDGILRIVFTGISHTSNTEVHIKHRQFVKSV